MIEMIPTFPRHFTKILLMKLEAIGFHNNLKAWLLSFLIERVQIVNINNFISKQIAVNSGISKGAYCSPLLFSLFINDIIPTIKCSSCLMLTDDTVGQIMIC